MGLFTSKKKKDFTGLQQAHLIVAKVLELHILHPIQESRGCAREWYQFCKVLESNVKLWKEQARKKINERVDDDES